jgi:vacuolar-type H+-ATPase subunit I/STV1
MITKTPRTDAALGGLLYSHPYLEKAVAEVALIETELQEAKSQIAFLDRQVHIHDEMLAGLEEAQTICEAQQEALNHLSTLTIPISDVKLLLEALAYYTHQPYSAAARAVDAFFTKHPDLKL